MHDLFGDPIELSIQRGKASVRLGSQIPEVQGTFAWAAGKPVEQARRGSPLTGKPPLPSSAPKQEAVPLDDDEADLEQALADLSLRGIVEQHLKDQNLSYVDVHEVHARLFSGAELDLFDFVVQAPEGHNWLLYAAPLSTAAQEDLREWERIFGPGFHALVADKVEEDEDTFILAFRTLDGERVDL